MYLSSVWIFIMPEESISRTAGIAAVRSELALSRLLKKWRKKRRNLFRKLQRKCLSHPEKRTHSLVFKNTKTNHTTQTTHPFAVRSSSNAFCALLSSSWGKSDVNAPSIEERVFFPSERIASASLIDFFLYDFCR